MSRIRMVSFTGRRMCFARDLTLFRYDLGKGVPVVSIQYTRGEMFELIVEPLQWCRITTTEYPGHGSPGATIHGFNDPHCPFFDGIKCHISSNAIS